MGLLSSCGVWVSIVVSALVVELALEHLVLQ